jgi:hypothetical protein
LYELVTPLAHTREGSRHALDPTLPAAAAPGDPAPSLTGTPIAPPALDRIDVTP